MAFNPASVGKSRLSQIYGFDPAKADFIDVDLEDDLVLFVDPLLFWRSPHHEHHIVHAKVIKFFEEAIEQVKNGQTSKARKKFIFPEPENLLGVSSKGHSGHGMSKELGGRVFDSIIQNKDILNNGLHFINELQLVIDDVGPDLISDMTVNIAKEYFVEYTQKNCQKFNIPLEKTKTEFFIEEEGIWDERNVLLPINPDTKKGFLLTPRIVVRRRDLSLNYKEVYRDHLRDIFKERVEQSLEGLARKPKVTWKLVKEYYPNTKSVVVDAINNNPKLRHEVAESVDRDFSRRGLEVTMEAIQGLEHSGLFDSSALRDISLSLDKDEDLKSEIESVLKSNPAQALLFIDQVNSVIEKSGNDLVVVLGSYSPTQNDPFDEVKNFLKDKEYEPCVIKDMPDIHQVNPRQKLFTYAALSRFLVVLDFGPSGHLNEIELLKDLTKPVVIISENKKGASYMTQGLEFSHTFFKRFTLEDLGSLKKCLESGEDWANDQINALKNLNKAELPWLAKE